MLIFDIIGSFYHFIYVYIKQYIVDLRYMVSFNASQLLYYLILKIKKESKNLN
jgi:hypothetical protein